MTGCASLFGNLEKVADEIRHRIRQELGITVSIGVSWNKIFSKLGSDLKKPDAITSIHREDFMEKIWPLPAKELLYVGPSTARKLSKYGITTIGGLARIEPEFLRKLLGKWGEVLWIFANGLDSVPVSKSGVESVIKSIGNSITTPRDMTDQNDIWKAVFVLSESVCARLRKHGFKGRTVQISVKDVKLGYREYQQSLPSASYLTTEIADCAMSLFKRNWDFSLNVRALGVRATRLVAAGSALQTSLLTNEEMRQKLECLEASIDDIRRRFGHYSIQRAVLLGDTLANPQNPAGHVVHPTAYLR
jgi:DNA polymerase-4